MTSWALEIFGKCLNKVDDQFKTFEDFTLEENDNIRKELEGCKYAKLEIRQTITILECRFIEVLSTINAMKAKVKALEKQVNDGVVGAARNVVVMKEAKIEAPKPPMFKRIHDAHEIENFFLAIGELFQAWKSKGR